MIEVKRRPFNVAEYYHLAEVGILHEDDRVELIEGVIIDHAAEITPRRFSADEYEQMVEAGILSEDDQVELVMGEIVEMAAIGSRHSACVDQLTELLVLHKTPNTSARVQNPLRIGKHSELQPDLMLLQRRPDFYRQVLPTPTDVVLLIEVADSSTEYDHEVKLPIYAHADIPEVWLVDLPGEAVEIYTQPANGVYQQSRTIRRGESFTSPALPGLTLGAELILG